VVPVGLGGLSLMPNTVDAADLDDVVTWIAAELPLSPLQIRAAVELLAAGNTVPFIARYRKEATQGLDEVALRAIEDAWEKLQALTTRRTTVLKSLQEQGVLTDDLRAQIVACRELAALEAIYLPFKPKRRTRAMVARELGLQPLADLLLRQERLGRSKQATLQAFVDPDRGVPDAAAAWQGAADIIAEYWADQPAVRQWAEDQAQRFGRIYSKLKRGQTDPDNQFELYHDHREAVRKVPSHRLLAMWRGQTEGLLRVGLELDEDPLLGHLQRQLHLVPSFEFHRELIGVVEDCWRRLLLPATESTVLQALKERADAEAIAVFGKNLRELLLTPPAGQRVTLGIDPGFRTGCKVAVVDATGKFLENATIYPTPPQKDTATAERVLLGLIRKHAVQMIAIGNGTASRETDAFVSELLRRHSLSLTKVMVSEAGASVYSASELAAREFPQLDLTIRGAISIARRLQDPLAELVKTDPKSIGVGQYQHDVNQTQLRKCLDRVVESCVNQVGVDLNSASAPLLSYVAGIGPKLAESIVEYRDMNGQFTSRRQLLSVTKLGKKAFEQAAGFLRIRQGEQPLDNSAVHPERYSLVEQMARAQGVGVADLVGNPAVVERISPQAFVSPQVGLPTITDILAELSKPGRDPRKEFQAVQFDESIQSLEDLREGLVLEGVITNVTHFGAFVDIGVHQDALIHVSQLSHEFVRDPHEVVRVGQLVQVKVVEVDIPRRRISVTRKFHVN
jgi:uncharacterized protein